MRESRDEARVRVEHEHKVRQASRLKANPTSSSGATDAAMRKPLAEAHAAQVKEYYLGHREDPEAWSFLTPKQRARVQAKVAARKVAFAKWIERRGALRAAKRRRSA